MSAPLLLTVIHAVQVLMVRFGELVKVLVVGFVKVTSLTEIENWIELDW